MLSPGTIIGSHYKVIRLLGQGGMSNIYICEDMHLFGKVWAVKEFTASYADPAEQEEALKHFEREAKMLASLSHPNLPTINEYFQFQGKYCLAMEYVEGPDLGKIMEKSAAPIPEVEAADWCMQIATVLYYLHCQKPPIIFRDVKPSNAILTPNGTIKLIDFGIARHFTPGKRGDTMRIGSPGYAPPEQYNGQTDQRSDVYSLGVTLHQAVTGQDPTLSPNPFKFTPVLEANPAVSPELAEIVTKAIKLIPEERYQTMLEFKKALKAFLISKNSLRGMTTPNLTMPAGATQPYSALPAPYAAAAAQAASGQLQTASSVPAAAAPQPAPAAQAPQHSAQNGGQTPEPAKASQPSAQGSQPPLVITTIAPSSLPGRRKSELLHYAACTVLGAAAAAAWAVTLGLWTPLQKLEAWNVNLFTLCPASRMYSVISSSCGQPDRLSLSDYTGRVRFTEDTNEALAAADRLLKDKDPDPRIFMMKENILSEKAAAERGSRCVYVNAVLPAAPEDRMAAACGFAAAQKLVRLKGGIGGRQLIVNPVLKEPIQPDNVQFRRFKTAELPTAARFNFSEEAFVSPCDLSSQFSRYAQLRPAVFKQMPEMQEYGSRSVVTATASCTGVKSPDKNLYVLQEAGLAALCADGNTKNAGKDTRLMKTASLKSGVLLVSADKLDRNFKTGAGVKVIITVPDFEAIGSIKLPDSLKQSGNCEVWTASSDRSSPFAYELANLYAPCSISKFSFAQMHWFMQAADSAVLAASELCGIHGRFDGAMALYAEDGSVVSPKRCRVFTYSKADGSWNEKFLPDPPPAPTH